MLGGARRRLLAPSSGVLYQIRLAVTGGAASAALIGGAVGPAALTAGAVGSRLYSSDFDLGKKPGDWDCTTCFHLNFSRRDSCQRCGNPKPLGGATGDARGWGAADVKPGDWFCSSCNTHNFASRATCFKCGLEKVETNSSMDGRPGWRSGDWLCSGCNEHNFASRSECFKCNAPRESGKEVSA